MAIEKRDWIMLGIGFGIGFLVLTTIGRRTVMAVICATKAETERLLSKIEAKSKKRSKI